MCDCCNSQTETLAHVFSCPSPETEEHQEKALQALKAELQKLRMPDKLVAAISHDIDSWTTSQHTPEHHIQAQTRGSLAPSDIILTQAFV